MQSEAHIRLMATLIKHTEESRKAITLYKRQDEGLAMFRIQATRRLIELNQRVVMKRPLPKDLKKYFKRWLSEPAGGVGDLFRAYVADVERVTGRKIKFD